MGYYTWTCPKCGAGRWFLSVNMTGNDCGCRLTPEELRDQLEEQQRLAAEQMFSSGGNDG